LHWHNNILSVPSVIKKAITFKGELAGSIVSFERGGLLLLGYWLGKRYWGKGIATAAIKQFLPLVSERPLHAHVAVHNVASKRVLLRVGFQEAESFTESLNDGTVVTVVHMVLEG
jgi:RimJ/RimL family protein N-acetyltransferase